MRIEVIRAWPHRHESMVLSLPAGASAGDALKASGFGLPDDDAGLAVHGERVTVATALNDGDRLEVLRPLETDPKESRRRRAAGAKRSR